MSFIDALYSTISENEIIHISKYFTETCELGMEQQSAAKKGQTSNKVSNEVDALACKLGGLWYMIHKNRGR